MKSENKHALIVENDLGMTETIMGILTDAMFHLLITADKLVSTITDVLLQYRQKKEQ